MSRAIELSEGRQGVASQIKTLIKMGLPEPNTWVKAPNIYGTDHELKAMIVTDMGEDYHKRDELSHSQFLKFREEPEIFAEKYLGEPDPDMDKPHFKFGREAEHVLFYGELPFATACTPRDVMSKRRRSKNWFEENEVEYDENDPDHHTYAKAGNKYHEWVKGAKESHEKSGDPRPLKILTEKEYEADVQPLLDLEKNCREHEQARRLIWGEGVRHLAVVFTCPYTGVYLRCQLDIASAGRIVVDYKTCARNDEWKYAMDFERWGYHIQSTWYSEAIRQLTGETDYWPVVYIAQEKESKCWIVEVYEIDEEWIEIGHFEWKDELAHFKTCAQTNVWKRRSHNKVIRLRPPVYKINEFKRRKANA